MQGDKRLAINNIERGYHAMPYNDADVAKLIARDEKRKERRQSAEYKERRKARRSVRIANQIATADKLGLTNEQRKSLRIPAK